MEATNKDCFAVVQDDYELTNWQVAAELLAEIVGLPAVTARQKARNSHGFLANNLPEDLAQRLRNACAGHGIGVQLVPQSEVIPVIKPMRMHRVWITDDALWVRAANLDAKTPLAWDTLRLIAMTKTTKSESFQHWETTGGDDEVRLKVTPYTEDVTEYLVDVFAFRLDGQVLGVRLMSRELNYAEALGNLAPTFWSMPTPG